jgi:hypothetical protein
MAPALADGKIFLKGLKTGGRADGPPLETDLGYLGSELGLVKKRSSSCRSLKERSTDVSFPNKVVNFLWP